jgi:hypothetical protein
MDDIKAKTEELKPKKKTNNQDFVASGVVEKFLQKFVGLSSIMTKQFNKIEHDRINNIESKNEEKPSSCLFIFTSMFYGLLFILFLVFTLLSLMQLRPPDESFFMNLAFEKTYYNNAQDYLTVGEFKEDLSKRITNLFYNSTTNSNPIEKENLIINSIRMSVYKTLRKDCDDAFEALKLNAYTDNYCYVPLFSDEMTKDKGKDNQNGGPNYDFYQDGECIKNINI